MSTQLTTDGGPAFPYGQKNFTIRSSEGMSLRDYFAGQAMAGICSDLPLDCSTPEDISIFCYRCADAMLARKGGAK